MIAGGGESWSLQLEALEYNTTSAGVLPLIKCHQGKNGRSERPRPGRRRYQRRASRASQGPRKERDQNDSDGARTPGPPAMSRMWVVRDGAPGLTTGPSVPFVDGASWPPNRTDVRIAAAAPASLSGVKPCLPAAARPPRAGLWLVCLVARQFPMPVGSCRLHVSYPSRRRAGGRAGALARSPVRPLPREVAVARLLLPCARGDTTVVGSAVAGCYGGPWDRGRRPEGGVARLSAVLVLLRAPRGARRFGRSLDAAAVALKKHTQALRHFVLDRRSHRPNSECCSARYNGPMR